MLKIIISVAVVGLAALLSLRRSREWLLEEVKALSDTLLLRLLDWTSQFGSELTRDGKAEQRLWREQRLRDLRGLALRSRQRQQRAKEKAG
jgi:hypothetical protein